MPKKKRSVPTFKTPDAPTPTQNLEDLRAAKSEWFSRLLRQRRELPPTHVLLVPLTPDPARNIQGVGIGEKMVDGRHTGVLAVKFLVRAKYHRSQISKKHALPKSIAGLPVDVEQVGQFRCFRGARAAADPTPDPRRKIRPAQPGCSVGFADPNNEYVMAGTFGALVKDENGVYYILSNNHVLAEEDLLQAPSPVFQPGLADSGNKVTFQIGQLTRSVHLKPDVPNEVDCAIASVSRDDVSSAILQIGEPHGTKNAQMDMVVHKFGLATHFTAGRVTSVETGVVHMQYHRGTYAFDGQIAITGLDGTRFSADGDSGALIVERGSNAAVGLLIGGSGDCTIANHINDVLKSLNVSLA
jgi:hypothetical protein